MGPRPNFPLTFSSSGEFQAVEGIRLVCPEEGDICELVFLRARRELISVACFHCFPTGPEFSAKFRDSGPRCGLQPPPASSPLLESRASTNLTGAVRAGKVNVWGHFTVCSLQLLTLSMQLFRSPAESQQASGRSCCLEILFLPWGSDSTQHPRHLGEDALPTPQCGFCFADAHLLNLPSVWISPWTPGKGARCQNNVSILQLVTQAGTKL